MTTSPFSTAKKIADHPFSLKVTEKKHWYYDDYDKDMFVLIHGFVTYFFLNINITIISFEQISGHFFIFFPFNMCRIHNSKDESSLSGLQRANLVHSHLQT